MIPVPKVPACLAKAALALAGAAVAVSCASPPARFEVRARNAGPGMSGTPAAEQRVARYYTDETGAVWDDTGCRQGPGQDDAMQACKRAR